MSLKVYFANINSFPAVMEIYSAGLSSLPSVVEVSHVEIQAIASSMELSWIELDSNFQDNSTLLADRLPLFKGALFIGNLYDGVLYTAPANIIDNIVRIYGKRISSKIPRKYRSTAPFFRN